MKPTATASTEWQVTTPKQLIKLYLINSTQCRNRFSPLHSVSPATQIVSILGPSKTAVTTDLEKRITDAFLIFDHQGNKTVDVREIGTILRYLRCVPSENEINDVISATELEDSNGTIHLARFLPHVTQLLAEHK